MSPNMTILWPQILVEIIYFFITETRNQKLKNRGICNRNRNFKNRNRKLNSAYSTSKKVTSFFSVVVSNGKIPQPQLITALEKN